MVLHEIHSLGDEGESGEECSGGLELRNDVANSADLEGDRCSQAGIDILSSQSSSDNFSIPNLSNLTENIPQLLSLHHQDETSPLNPHPNSAPESSSGSPIPPRSQKSSSVLTRLNSLTILYAIAVCTFVSMAIVMYSDVQVGNVLFNLTEKMGENKLEDDEKLSRMEYDSMEQFDKLRERLDGLSEQLVQAVDNLEKKNNDLKDENAVLRRANEDLEEKVNSVTIQNDGLKELNRELRKENHDIKEEIVKSCQISKGSWWHIW